VAPEAIHHPSRTRISRQLGEIQTTRMIFHFKGHFDKQQSLLRKGALLFIETNIFIGSVSAA